MAKLEIEIQTRKMLKPSTPTPTHLRILRLSLLDQLSPRMYVPILFHYLPTSGSEGITTACAKLQNSLAETLTKFYPLAGRFREDEFSVHCNDEGVEYVETKVVNADLAEFLHQGTKNTELLNDLLPEIDDQRPSSPLLGVQVNLFHCGGVVIGIQISHTIADAFTLASFVKEWAHVCQTGTVKAGCLLSFGQLHSLFPATATQLPSPPNNTTGGPKFVTRRFVFDALAIANLKNTIKDLRPTRVVVVLSLIWKVLAGISSKDSCLFIPINMREKSNIPSLEHALGNYVTVGVAHLEAEKEMNDLVGKTIRDTCLLIGKAASVDDISFLVVSNWIKYVDKFHQGDKMDIYPCTSWCRLPWYEADFGWGRPSWVSSVSGDIHEVISLFDTKSGDGIEAWVTLKENVMAEFESNPHILTFCPPLPK